MKILIALAVVLALPAAAQPNARPVDDRDYQRGTRALDRSKWDDAIAAFADAAALKGPRADGALYWKAYAEFKAGKGSTALKTLAQFEASHPNSRWLNDAKALKVEVQQAAGQPPGADAADSELRLIALNGLMSADPERAVPLLEKILQSKTDAKLRERALFVLAQSKAERARQILAGIAKGGANPDLQIKAIEYLGVHGGQGNRQLLDEIYRSSSDVPLKRRILDSFMVSGERDRLFQLAQSEPIPELRRKAIELLGVSGGRQQLADLYAKESSVDLKKAILDGLFVAGDAERITQLAKTEKDPALRREAISKLGVMGRRTGDTLIEMYGAEADSKIKAQILDALFVQGNAKALVSVARQEKDAALRKQAVEKLSIMRAPEATEFMMELLNK